jgi:hypothetical protein
MTTRPLLRHTIGQLEEMFAANPTDMDTLKALDGELQHRNKPRASVLLRKVKSALSGSSPLTPLAQPELFAQAQVLPRAAPAPFMTTPDVVLPEAAAKPDPPIDMLPPMTLDEAYKVLRVSAGAPWAEVEKARTNIVQRSNPDNIASMSTEKRLAVQTDAKRANVAYSVILQSRSG